MSIILATILALSANPNGAADQTAAPAAPAAQAAPRVGRELSDAAHAAMRQWAKATDQEADAAAKELLGIYREILQDTGMARSQRESLRVTVRARLDQLCTQISKRIAKDKAAANSTATVQSVGVNNGPRANVLAGVGLPAGGGTAATGQNANADAGQQLVDLIQTTIAPKTWDVNGGNASIYYWQQQHAIVVRATSEVHGQISDTLEQLNRATH
jgi:hypothetical protein